MPTYERSEEYEMQRRDFLQTVTAIGAAAGLPLNAQEAYSPKAKMEIEVTEVPFRTTAKGRPLLARVYAPTGAAPLPTVMDLPGGAGTRRCRFAPDPMDRAV